MTSKSEWYLYIWDKKSKSYALSNIALGRDIEKAKIIAKHYRIEYPEEHYILKLLRTEIVLV